MGRQRSDYQVAHDAALFNRRIGELRAFLRSCGIRNVSTSKAAKAAIARASRPEYPKEAKPNA